MNAELNTAEQLFNRAKKVVSAAGWKKGYNAPDYLVFNVELHALVKQVITENQVENLREFTKKYMGRDYNAGLADLLFGKITLMQMR